MDCVISELCCKATILQRNYRKITILWSFSYNSFVKLHSVKTALEYAYPMFQIIFISDHTEQSDEQDMIYRTLTKSRYIQTEMAKSICPSQGLTKD